MAPLQVLCISLSIIREAIDDPVQHIHLVLISVIKNLGVYRVSPFLAASIYRDSHIKFCNLKIWINSAFKKTPMHNGFKSEVFHRSRSHSFRNTSRVEML